MEHTRLLAERVYAFILKYDKCINKYEKQYIENDEMNSYIKNEFQRMIEEIIKPYKNLTKGKEVQELEKILLSDPETIRKYISIHELLRRRYI